jgi:hypothetical protein
MTASPIADSFVESDERFSMPQALPYLFELAERGMDRAMPRRAVEDVTAAWG